MEQEFFFEFLISSEGQLSDLLTKMKENFYNIHNKIFTQSKTTPTSLEGDPRLGRELP